MAAFIGHATSVTSLGMGTYNLMRARVASARGELEATLTAATEALARFRVSNAPWWKAKAIRVIERAGATDSALVAEVEQIERALGAIRPTP